MQKIQKFAQNVFVKRKEEEDKHGLSAPRLKTWSDCRPPSSEAESIAKASKFSSGIWFNNEPVNSYT